MALIQQAVFYVSCFLLINFYYVVTSAEAGSKLTKAQELGVTVIDEVALRGILSESTGE